MQEQIFTRDIPFLKAVLPVEFSTVLVKGRSNYISLRRMKLALERAGTLFGDPQESEQLHQLADWAPKTTEGVCKTWRFDRSALSGMKSSVTATTAWAKNVRRSTTVTISKLDDVSGTRTFSSSITRLFFSDLAMRREGGSILPDYDIAILDEAHTVEAVAGDHMGLSLSSGQINYQLNKLWNDRTMKGLFAPRTLLKSQMAVHETRHKVNDFFSELEHFQSQFSSGNGRLHAADH